MKHKIITLVLAVAIIAGLVLVGCVKPAASPEGPTPTPKPPEPIVWRFNSTSGPISYKADCWRVFSAEIEKLSDGRLIIEHHWSSSMGITAMDVLPALQSGRVEISEVAGGTADVALPLFGLVNMPFLHATVDEAIEWELNTLLPMIMEEMNEKWGIRILGAQFYPGPTLLYSKEPLRTLEAMQGVPVRTWGGTPMEALAFIGFAPFVIDMAELYTALQRGMVSAAITSEATAADSHFWEVLNYVDNIVLSQQMIGICVSNDIFNSVPKDLQDMLIAAGQVEQRWSLENREVYNDKYKEMLIDGGMEYISLDPGEIEKIIAKVEPLHRSYIEQYPECVPLLRDLGVLN